MNHLKSAHLKNFGPWKDQIFEFHEGVNVIIGESGHGKSAMLKALDFVLNNKTPKSAAGVLGFITRPEERGKIAEVAIEMFTEDSIDKIIRRRGKSTNNYQLNDDKPQKAFGRGVVPDHIAKIINMSSVNYHKQKDLPFLLDEKPGAVAKQLSSIINLDEIDESESLAKSCVSENKKLLKSEINELESLDTQLSELHYVQEFKAKVDSFIIIQNNFYQKNNKFNKIDTILSDIDSLRVQIAQYTDLIALGDAVESVGLNQVKFARDTAKFDKIVEILNQLEDFDNKQKRYSMLIGLGNKIEINENNIKILGEERNKNLKIRKILNNIKQLKISSEQSLELLNLSEKIDQLQIKQMELSDRNYEYEEIADCLDSIKELNNQKKQIDKWIDQEEFKLDLIACPLCGHIKGKIDG